MRASTTGIEQMVLRMRVLMIVFMFKPWCGVVRICARARVLRRLNARRCGGGGGKGSARDRSCCGRVGDVESLPKRAMRVGEGVWCCHS
jgi:hypothetical protein